jgi:hypothetical protein
VRRRSSLHALVAIVYLVASPALAVAWQDVQSVCKQNQEACDLYLLGLLDALVLANGANVPLEKYCIPKESISNETFVAVFKKLLEDYPEAATRQTAALAHVALARAFPCRP